LQVGRGASASEWRDIGTRAEGLGFSTVVVPDHVADGLLSPMVALATLAEVTTSVRLGTFVLDNDFRHPALLAREAATLDLLSDGRFDLGIGAGHAAPEYAEIGLPFDRAGVRVSRLEESARLLRRLFDGETVTVNGAHYSLVEHRLFPARRPRLLVGGAGDRVLRLGAEVADVVGFTGLGRTLPDGQKHEIEWEPAQIDAKVALVRDAAGARLDDIEFNALVQLISLTDDRSTVAAGVGRELHVDPAVVLGSPYMLIGTVEEIVDQLHAARERWGFSYFVTRDAEQTAPVIAALS
jgi:probable F420-dependent oxidoreductase